MKKSTLSNFLHTVAKPAKIFRNHSAQTLASIFIMMLSITFSIPSASADGKVAFSFENGLPGIESLEKMTFTREDSILCKSIVHALERYHYSNLEFNDELSSRILDQYLNTLDPSKSLFTKSEINEFEKVRYWLDNTLEKGELTPGYAIFNIYLERSFIRLTHILNSIEKWETLFDFNAEEEIILDRTDLPWPENLEELKKIWDSELKNTILSLKLDGESNEDITNLLSKRYKSRLNRLLQTDTADTFKIYINSVAMTFDPHTQFFPPRMSEDFDIQMSLSLEGIGAVLQSEYEYTKVVSLVPAGPADKSGQLMPGDKIIGVGQGVQGPFQDTVGWRIDEVVNLIRGPKDTMVRLRVIPAAQKGVQNARTVSIKRDKVKLEEQAASKEIVTINRNGRTLRVGTITIPTFYLDFKGMQEGSTDYKSTTRDVMNLLNDLKNEKIDGLIIDLRDNGGGALQEVNQLTGLFIKSGPTVQIRSRNGYMSRLEDPDPVIYYRGPLMVMINRMSASASEIFAGAIKDYHRGIIVGTRTFGKGTVQALQPIEDGQLKLTTSKFYRVSGESTQNLGVLPDIEFPSIYNSDETGESSLDGALPWDKSIKANYNSYKSMTPLITALKQKHTKRVDNQPGFTYLKKRFELSKELYTLKTLPLNIEKRKAYKERMNSMELEIENHLRVSKGLEPVSSIEEIHQDDEETEELSDNSQKNTSSKKKDKDDILLDEAREMMADLITESEAKRYRW
ncbi:Prc [Desulfamplus magnetovallimortis]|uniref:Prc n=1 Tax=Desulfamplus magnetovallimortis TaxID=1246637 RepID=A0A1W1H6B2_9BACT|nr:carboxy terminal-processing peptidase [Desulfamplus magnetovallimortis]SLM27925.1 Prc [Desulfamplus magnetovallimortis]